MKNNLIPVIPFHEQIIERGEGSYIYDTEGKRYLDVNAGQFCTVLGHSNPELAECIAAAARKIAHTNTAMLSSEVLKAADNINRISGELDASVILLSTGSEAVEFCIRYAKHIAGKKGIACFDKGYHGLTLGSQSVTYAGVYAMPNVENIFPFTIPDTFADSDGIEACKEELHDLLKHHSNEIAAILVEPIVSVGGMIFPCNEYFEYMRRLCDEYGVLMIFDESQTGFGRTGEWFAYQHMKCVPDIVACSKGIGLGYPVAAAMFSKRLIPDGGFKMTHYSSHQNDAFAAAIINFAIKYIEDNNILEEVRAKGAYLLERLNEAAAENPAIYRPRGNGLMAGFDLMLDGVVNYRPIAPKLYDICADKGLIIQMTNGGQTMRFLPDYLISREQIDDCVRIVNEAINELKEKLLLQEADRYGEQRKNSDNNSQRR